MSASGHRGQDSDATPAPLLIRRSPHAPIGVLLLAIASLWLVVVILGVVAGDLGIVPGLGSSGAYWAGGVGTALAVLGLHWIVRRQRVVVDRGTLFVTERSLFGRCSWREPLANYREIRRRIERRPHRYGPRSWHLVQLWHPEPARRIELARARNPAAVEALARDCARRFGLPLVREQPQSAAVQPVGADPARERSPGESAAPVLPGRSLSAS